MSAHTIVRQGTPATSGRLTSAQEPPRRDRARLVAQLRADLPALIVTAAVAGAAAAGTAALMVHSIHVL